MILPHPVLINIKQRKPYYFKYNTENGTQSNWMSVILIFVRNNITKEKVCHNYNKEILNETEKSFVCFSRNICFMRYIQIFLLYCDIVFLFPVSFVYENLSVLVAVMVAIGQFFISTNDNNANSINNDAVYVLMYGFIYFD